MSFRWIIRRPKTAHSPRNSLTNHISLFSADMQEGDHVFNLGSPDSSDEPVITRGFVALPPCAR